MKIKKYNEILIPLLFLVPFFLQLVHIHLDTFLLIVYFIVIFPFLLIKLSEKKHRLFYFILSYLILFSIIGVKIYNGGLISF
jgi:hypothetical protein